MFSIARGNNLSTKSRNRLHGLIAHFRRKSSAVAKSQEMLHAELAKGTTHQSLFEPRVDIHIIGCTPQIALQIYRQRISYFFLDEESYQTPAKPSPALQPLGELTALKISQQQAEPILDLFSSWAIAMKRFWPMILQGLGFQRRDYCSIRHKK